MDSESELLTIAYMQGAASKADEIRALRAERDALKADAKRMRSALKVISTWASYDLEHCGGIAVALDAEHTLDLAKKALNADAARG